MKRLGCSAFALLALIIIGGCSESNEYGSWKLIAWKDKITDASKSKFVSRAKDGRNSLAIQCTNTESPVFMLASNDFARYEPRAFYVRAGSKAAITQDWAGLDGVAFPGRPYIGFELVDYVGAEETLIIRAKGESGQFDYAFGVNGLPAAFAKMKDFCKRQAS
jgi:hypothetical protein